MTLRNQVSNFPFLPPSSIVQSKLQSNKSELLLTIILQIAEESHFRKLFAKLAAVLLAEQSEPWHLITRTNLLPELVSIGIQ